MAVISHALQSMRRRGKQVSSAGLLPVAAFLYAFVPSLAGCATGGSELADTTWVLVQEEQSESSLLGDAEITLEFYPGEGVVRGSYGYNKYEGSYEVDGDSLAISSDLCFTTMACQAEGAMDEEQQHLFALMEAESYVIKGDTLTINAGDEKLVFHAA